MSEAANSREQVDAAAIARPLVRNIRALMARREQEKADAPTSEKVAAAIANFTGSMWSVLLHAAVFGLWVLVNLEMLPIVEPWDPTFVVLAMIASVEAIFLSTFVLMNQNRLARADDRRADLTLQIGLLAEYETTKLVELTSAIARHLDAGAPEREQVTELTEEIDPEAVLDQIDRERPE